MPHYAFFGDTVNTASRMESNSLPGFVHMSAATHALLSSSSGWDLHERGDLPVKGKGASSLSLLQRLLLIIRRCRRCAPHPPLCVAHASPLPKHPPTNPAGVMRTYFLHGASFEADAPRAMPAGAVTKAVSKRRVPTPFFVDLNTRSAFSEMLALRGGLDPAFRSVETSSLSGPSRITGSLADSATDTAAPLNTMISRINTGLSLEVGGSDSDVGGMGMAGSPAARTGSLPMPPHAEEGASGSSLALDMVQLSAAAVPELGEPRTLE
jgi:hypothetical protein